MTAWLIDSVLRLRRLVVAAVVAVLGLGVVQLQNARVDVYPEFDATQVEVQAEAPGGFPDSEVSVVRDNAKQLKFKPESTGFED